MLVHVISRRCRRVQRTCAIVPWLTSGCAMLITLLLVSCGNSSGPDADGGGATLSGTVRAAVGSTVLGDVTISGGGRQATSDASGQFELTDLPVGPASVRAERPGYLPAEALVSITAGANTHDFALSAQEVFVSGAYATYVPSGVGPLRGVIISLGGGVTTSGFVTGGNLEGTGELEESLQALGASLRALAQSAHVALLGTTTHSLANSAASDDLLFTAMRTVAGLSGHAEIAAAPVLTFGLDAGSAEAFGVALRHPERTIGVIVRVPISVPDLTAPSALAVPTFVMQSELDERVDNTQIQSTFATNRSRGGLWALAVEPGIQHAVATGTGNAANVGWIATALALRLPAATGDPLVALDEASGWLGNQTTLEIAPWADYPGSRSTASWLLSESAATSWRSVGGGN
jgi:hypothetical protein